MDHRGSSQGWVLEDSRRGLEEAMTLVVSLPLDKNQGSLRTGKESLWFVICLQFVLLVLIPVVEVATGLTLRNSKEAVLEFDAGVADCCETRLDPEELSELGPRLARGAVILGVVLIQFDVGIAHYSMLVLQLRENLQELFDVGVPCVVDKEKNRFEMSALRSALNPPNDRCRLTKDDVWLRSRHRVQVGRDVCGHYVYDDMLRAVHVFKK